MWPRWLKCVVLCLWGMSLLPLQVWRLPPARCLLLPPPRCIQTHRCRSRRSSTSHLQSRSKPRPHGRHSDLVLETGTGLLWETIQTTYSDGINIRRIIVCLCASGHSDYRVFACYKREKTILFRKALKGLAGWSKAYSQGVCWLDSCWFDSSSIVYVIQGWRFGSLLQRPPLLVCLLQITLKAQPFLHWDTEHLDKALEV